MYILHLKIAIGNTRIARNFGYNDPDFLKQARACCKYSIEQNGLLRKYNKKENDTYQLRKRFAFRQRKDLKQERFVWVTVLPSYALLT